MVTIAPATGLRSKAPGTASIVSFRNSLRLLVLRQKVRDGVIPRGFAVMTAMILSTHQFTGFGIDSDAFPSTNGRRGIAQRIAIFFRPADCIGEKQARGRGLSGSVLVMGNGRLHGLL